MGKALDLLRSIFPRMETPFQDTQEIAGEVERQEAIAIQATEPLERPVIMGPLFPSRKAMKRMIEIVEGLRRGLIKGMAASETFHMRSGLHIDVTIRKPYRIMKYKGDCIVKVYDDGTDLSDGTAPMPHTSESQTDNKDG